MSRIVRCSLIQATNAAPPDASLSATKQAMIDKHVAYIEQAAKEGVQIVCMQEIFTGPYFCAEQNTRWYDVAEPVPDGPTIRLMQDVARRHHIVLIVPVYEREQEGVYYNTAAVIGRDGAYLGKYRKTHIPHVAPGFWEKFYFRPGNLGYPVFDVGFAKIGVYICYDRHFPEGARALGLNGAEIVFNPSATVAGLSEHLWKLEQPAHAVANGYYIAAINRVGIEAPWNIGEFIPPPQIIPGAPEGAPPPLPRPNPPPHHPPPTPQKIPVPGGFSFLPGAPGDRAPRINTSGTPTAISIWTSSAASSRSASATAMTPSTPRSTGSSTRCSTSPPCSPTSRRRRSPRRSPRSRPAANSPRASSPTAAPRPTRPRS